MLEFLRPKTYRARYPRWLVGKPLLFTSSLLCSLGDAMFGYSQGCISTALVQPSFLRRMYGVQGITLDMIAKGDTGVSQYAIGITVACLNITAFIGALLSSVVCDVMGRRASMRLGSFLCFVAAIMQVFAPNLAVLITGRSIQGLGVGFLSMTVPIIQAEIAPGHARGIFITIENLFLNAGYSLSTWVGFAFYFAMPSEISWRGSYIVLSSFAFVLLSWTLILPETPRWLIKNGFHEEGLATLADLQAGGKLDDPSVKETYQEIAAAIQFEEELGGDCSWKDLFTFYTRRTIMGITSQMFAQLNGINAILYFLPENLLRAGFNIPKSLLYTGACSTMLVAGIIPTMFLIDSWGRRPILIFGGVGMVLCLSSVGGLQYYVDKLPDTSPNLKPAANGIFSCVCLYLAFFAFSWGPVPWLIPAEVFPLRARAKGMSLATGSNWMWNFIVAFASPPIFQVLRGGGYFLIAVFVFISILLAFFVYRETAHKTLEELSEVFGEKPFVNPSAVMVPDATNASVAMHMGARARSKSSMGPNMSKTGTSMARGMSLSRTITRMTNGDVVRGMSGIGTIQPTNGVVAQFGIPGAGMAAIGETPSHRGSNGPNGSLGPSRNTEKSGRLGASAVSSARTSQITIAADPSNEKK